MRLRLIAVVVVVLAVMVATLGFVKRAYAQQSCQGIINLVQAYGDPSSLQFYAETSFSSHWYAYILGQQLDGVCTGYGGYLTTPKPSGPAL